MTNRVHQNPHLIFSVGTKVVALRDLVSENGRILHPRGAVGVVVQAPGDLEGRYRVRFPDGLEESLGREDIVMLAHYKEGEIGEAQVVPGYSELYERVIYRCVVGSRAYGLEGDESDTDYRGIFLPSAEAHWSLYGVPPQIERHETQEHYWELQRFLVLALKANPNVLECLSYSVGRTNDATGRRIARHAGGVSLAACLSDLQWIRHVAVQEDAG